MHGRLLLVRHGTPWAHVTALDYASPEYSGFSIAHSVLGSAVEHHTCNVYDITVDRFGQFDLVLFLGVLYHLRNPMMALDQIRTVVADGGEIFVETATWYWIPHSVTAWCVTVGDGLYISADYAD